MSQNKSGDGISNTDQIRATLLFLTGIALLVYGGAQWFGYAPSPPWFVYTVVGIGLFVWGIYRL